MHVVGRDELRQWLSASDLGDAVRGVGAQRVDTDYLADTLGLPYHLGFVAQQLAADDDEEHLDQLASLPFYSLCRGLFVPLSVMSPDKTASLFGVVTEPAPNTAGRQELLQAFLAKDCGLSLGDKLAAVLGDPFRGKPGSFRRDSLIRLLMSVRMCSRRELLDRLTVVGDVAVLFSESRPTLKAEPPLTAAEVLITLRLFTRKGVGRTDKFRLLRSLLLRMGKLEAYFLAKLVLRSGFGFDYQAQLIARVLAEHFGATPEAVAHAIALTDAFHVMEVLEEGGPEGLRSIRLQPLVPVRPALASGTTSQIKQWPVWVERKYDGIRFMLHKSTDSHGSVLAGAYTRNRRDWLELVPGLDQTIRALPAKNVIVDGELYGTVLDHHGARPATVYELYGSLQGERRPVQMKFAAFDLCYLNGTDLTSLPLSERRKWLQQLVGPLANFPTPVPLTVAEGHMAQHKDDIARLYGHFRSQGYEGLIAKDLQGAYRLSQRDPTWLKRKPEITLDLVLLGAVFAVTSKQNAGMFGSYVIGARSADGGFTDVGDVAGVDRQRDAEIQAEIMREGLITGQRIERQSASGVRPGMDLRPHIVGTVRFEGIVKDPVSGELKLRDPKLVHIRADKTALEADSVKDLEAIWLRDRMG
jgi:DNA ligase-1